MINNKYSYRVYYEDTDAGGIVYYANYLKFYERARTDLFRDIGIIQSELVTQENILFVVKDLTMNLIKPAKLDDMLIITNYIRKIGAASILLKQEIKNQHEEFINDIDITIVSVDNMMKIAKIPKTVKSKLER